MPGNLSFLEHSSIALRERSANASNKGLFWKKLSTAHAAETVYIQKRIRSGESADAIPLPPDNQSQLPNAARVAFENDSSKAVKYL